jgi:Polyketide cyclase / dehydrase and lipid transport
VNRYAVLCLAAAVAAGAALLTRGNYGLTLFLVLPAAIGAIGCLIVRPRNAGHAAGIGAIAALIASCSLFTVGAEGLICILMALPLTVPLGALGGWLAYSMAHPRQAGRGIAMCVLLPAASLSYDAHAVPPVYEVRSSIEIAAPPEQVWTHVVAFSELPEPPEWFFRAGVAYPQRARIVGSGPGAVRYCEFSTGPFVEPIEVWDEPRLLRFRVTANPAPCMNGVLMPTCCRNICTAT